MSESVKVIADKQDLVSIADAIRAKTETTDGIDFADMAALIEGIEGGAKVAMGSFTPTETVSCSAAIHYEGTPVTGSFTLRHNFGSIPVAGFFYASGEYINNINTIICALFCIGDSIYYSAASNTQGLWTRDGASSLNPYGSITNAKPAWCSGIYAPVCFYAATNDEISVVPGVSLANGNFVAGQTYKWVLIGE